MDETPPVELPSDAASFYAALTSCSLLEDTWPRSAAAPELHAAAVAVDAVGVESGPSSVEHAAFIGPSERPTPLPESTRVRLLAVSSGAAALDARNVGFRMLAAAGWTSGNGLGARAQGPTEPVDAFQKRDRRGIGGESVKSLALVGGSAAAPRAQQPPPPQAAPPGAGAGGGADADADASGAAQPGGLTKEGLAAYVRKRARDSALQRALFRAFADDAPPSAGARAAHAMRATNPLRGHWSSDNG